MFPSSWHSAFTKLVALCIHQTRKLDSAWQRTATPFLSRSDQAVGLSLSAGQPCLLEYAQRPGLNQRRVLYALSCGWISPNFVFQISLRAMPFPCLIRIRLVSPESPGRCLVPVPFLRTYFMVVFAPLHHCFPIIRVYSDKNICHDDESQQYTTDDNCFDIVSMWLGFFGLIYTLVGVCNSFTSLSTSVLQSDRWYY